MNLRGNAPPLRLAVDVSGREVDAGVDPGDTRLLGRGEDSRERPRRESIGVVRMVDERDVLAEQVLERRRRGRGLRQCADVYSGKGGDGRIVTQLASMNCWM